MLYLIGLGIYDEKDISLRGLEILKNVDEVYAEFYTSLFSGSLRNLEKLAGKKVNVLLRRDLEENSEKVIKKAKDRDIALLVPGDPMVATTHLSIVLKAREIGIKTRVIHASSVYSAIAETGLQIYKFGRTSSIAFPEKSYFPKSPYVVLKENLNAGLHTLFLLDIKAEEKKFMTIREGIGILLKIEQERKENIFTQKTCCVGVARLGSDNAIVKAGNSENLLKENFGIPPQVLIVPGKLHFTEKEALLRFQ